MEYPSAQYLSLPCKRLEGNPGELKLGVTKHPNDLQEMEVLGYLWARRFSMGCERFTFRLN